MKIWLISDTHFNHENIATYCQRPIDFTELIIKHWRNMIPSSDTVIHLGDVTIGNKAQWFMRALPGRKILVRGNHDRQKSCTWWMEHGFDFACDGLVFRNCWLTHEPAVALPEGCILNIHGHLHNIWHGFHPEGPKQGHGDELAINGARRLKHDWQRLFAIEYTNYHPVEFNKFIAQPARWQAIGPDDITQRSH
jgi:calcineurin-like phosphoesterase family protein